MTEIAKQGGLLTVDCVVICCCCPCIVLQVTIFLFIRLPHKLAVKSKRIILKKLHKRLRLRKRKAGDNNDSVVVVKRDDNECFWMEFDDPIQRSEPPAIRKSGNVLFLGSEEGNDEMNAWIAEDMKFVFGERNACLGDEEVWREMLERGVFWFGSFWANGDYLE
ncbi:uncharacterized protein LOC144544546 [Carex rostrata]